MKKFDNTRNKPANPLMLPKPKDLPKLGPAMMKLAKTPRKQAFVVAYVETGGRSLTRAAVLAGYPQSWANEAGNRILHDEDVQAAIREESERRLRGSALLATSILIEIMDDTTAAKKDRLRAVEMILDRSGLHAKSEHNVTVTHQVDEAGMIERAKELAARHGLDVQKLLGDGTVIEGEVVPVSVEDEVFEEEALMPDGIEDLL